MICNFLKLPPHGGSLSLPFALPEGYDTYVISLQSSAAFHLAVLTSPTAPHLKWWAGRIDCINFMGKVVEVPNMAIAALPGKKCHSSKTFWVHTEHVLLKWTQMIANLFGVEKVRRTFRSAIFQIVTFRDVLTKWKQQIINKIKLLT